MRLGDNLLIVIVINHFFEHFVCLIERVYSYQSLKSWPRALPQEIHGDIWFYQHGTTMSQCYQNKNFTASNNWVLSLRQELRDNLGKAFLAF